MNKEFIPYEQALELKELGFDEKCYRGYDKNQMLFYSEQENGHELNYSVGMNVSAPLYQQAFRWFREKHEMYVHTYALVNTETQKLHFTNNINDREGVFYATHEEAELACLKKLIELAKNK